MLNSSIASVIHKFRKAQKTGDSKADSKANAGAESRFELLVYLDLRANCRKRVAVSIETMMADLGKSKSIITNALDWLEVNGAVAKVPKAFRKDIEKTVRCVVYQLTGTINLEGESVVYLYPPKYRAEFEQALAEVCPHLNSSVNELFQDVISSVNELFASQKSSVDEGEKFSQRAEKVQLTKEKSSVDEPPSSIYLTGISSGIGTGISSASGEPLESPAGESVESVEKPGARAAKEAGLTTDQVAPILVALLKAGAVKYDTDKDKVLGLLARFPKHLETALVLAKRIEERATNNGETFSVNYFLKGFENEASRPQAQAQSESRPFGSFKRENGQWVDDRRFGFISPFSDPNWIEKNPNVVDMRGKVQKLAVAND